MAQKFSTGDTIQWNGKGRPSRFIRLHHRTLEITVSNHVEAGYYDVDCTTHNGRITRDRVYGRNFDLLPLVIKRIGDL